MFGPEGVPGTAEGAFFVVCCDGTAPVWVAKPVKSQTVGKPMPFWTLTGKPLAAVNTPLSCHPPTSPFTNRLVFAKNGLFFPKGSSKTPNELKTWVVS